MWSPFFSKIRGKTQLRKVAKSSKFLKVIRIVKHVF
jgi:hypothetical protein